MVNRYCKHRAQHTESNQRVSDSWYYSLVNSFWIDDVQTWWRNKISQCRIISCPARRDFPKFLIQSPCLCCEAHRIVPACRWRMWSLNKWNMFSSEGPALWIKWPIPGKFNMSVKSKLGFRQTWVPSEFQLLLSFEPQFSDRQGWCNYTPLSGDVRLTGDNGCATIPVYQLGSPFSALHMCSVKCAH